MVTQSNLDRDKELDMLQSHVEEALRLANQGGASAAEVSAHSSQGLSASVRLGEVETLEHMQDRGVSVTVYIGRRKGSASSADLRRQSLGDCVSKALDIARFTQEDSHNGLADPELLATEFPDLDLWHPQPLDAGLVIERARLCEEAGLAHPEVNNSEGGSFNAGLGLSVYGNSHGFIGRSGGTRFSQSCVLLAGEGEGMQRDYSYDSRRRLDSLESPEKTGQLAAERTAARLGAQRIDTAALPVVFSPEVAKGLIGHLVGAISGSALYRNASFLKDKAGERLFPDWLTIEERPHLLQGAGSASFDSEGVATRHRKLVDNGVLTGYVLSSYSARRLGLETTANAGGIHNLLLHPGGGSNGNLLSGLDRALYVTEVMGQGVSLVTGDYSRGASGFLVENGEISHPVEEVTIAGHLAEMFAGISSVGDDIDTRSNIQAGSVLVERMMVAGA